MVTRGRRKSTEGKGRPRRMMIEQGRTMRGHAVNNNINANRTAAIVITIKQAPSPRSSLAHQVLEWNSGPCYTLEEEGKQEEQHCHNSCMNNSTSNCQSHDHNSYRVHKYAHELDFPNEQKPLLVSTNLT